jgi:hypothetical protein
MAFHPFRRAQLGQLHLFSFAVCAVWRRLIRLKSVSMGVGSSLKALPNKALKKPAKKSEKFLKKGFTNRSSCDNIYLADEANGH